MFDSSKESVELFCVDAREKLTNSIRLQWRRLKSHVERLDSEGILHAAYCHYLILIHGVFFISVFCTVDVVKQISVTEQGTMKKESQSY